MERTRLVITGIGVVAPNGIGKEQFWANCAAGVTGIKPITLFDTSPYRCHWAGEVSNFHPETYLGSKGLRNLDRTTLLALVAAKLAIEDAKLDITDENRNDIGVVLGSTMGSVHSISEFDKEGLREGPRYVNPAHFPNTVINSPASQVAIRFGLKALNSTIATGFSASLDAIGYAMDMLRLGRASTLLVGGVEELCIQTFLGFYKLGLLATSQNGHMPVFKPFDPGHCGTLLGEGAAFFVVEPLEAAAARGATIWAELLGYASLFHPASMYRYDPEAHGPIEAIRLALCDAGRGPEDIRLVSACANSVKACDVMEAKALETIVDHQATSVTRWSSKELLGESFSAGGALQLSAVIGAASDQHAGVVARQGRSTDASWPSQALEQPCALVNAFGPTGVASALVIEGA